MIKYMLTFLTTLFSNSGAVKMEKKISDLLPIVDNYAESIIMKELGEISAPININKIIKQYGIQKFYAKLPEKESGAIIIKDDSCAMIINEDDNQRRKRFTAAHELGHFISYRYRGLTGERIDKRNLDSTTGKDIEEIFANKFAASILMPKSLMLKALNITQDVNILASLFDVSPESVKHRLKNI